MYKKILIIVWIMFIFGCGDNSSNLKNVLDNNHSITFENSNRDINNAQSNSNNHTKQEIGYLIDSPIVNMPYSCGGESKETSNGGKFECSSLPVTFEIGDLKIATVNKIPEDKKLYIQDIVGVNRDNIKDKRVLKLALLIQSLDDDGDISKEIYIKVRELNTPKKFIEDLDIDDVKEILNNSKEIKHIVTEDEVIKHLQNNSYNRENSSSIVTTSNTTENNNHTTTPENYNFQLNNNHSIINQDINNSSQTDSDDHNVTSDNNSTSNNNHTNQDINNSSQTDSDDHNVTSDNNSTSNNNHTNQDTNNSSQTDSSENNVTSDDNSTSDNNNTNQDINNSSQTDNDENNVTSDSNNSNQIVEDIIINGTPKTTTNIFISIFTKSKQRKCKL